jgi:hypothetical protein
VADEGYAGRDDFLGQLMDDERYSTGYSAELSYSVRQQV